MMVISIRCAIIFFHFGHLHLKMWGSYADLVLNGLMRWPKHNTNPIKIKLPNSTLHHQPNTNRTVNTSAVPHLPNHCPLDIHTSPHQCYANNRKDGRWMEMEAGRENHLVIAISISASSDQDGMHATRCWGSAPLNE